MLNKQVHRLVTNKPVGQCTQNTTDPIQCSISMAAKYLAEMYYADLENRSLNTYKLTISAFYW